MIFAAFPVGPSLFGGGVCFKYIAFELARLDSVRLITDAFDASGLGDEIEYRRLAELVPTPEEGQVLQARLDHLPGGVLQCITGKQLLPMKPGLRGDVTVGYAF